MINPNNNTPPPEDHSDNNTPTDPAHEAIEQIFNAEYQKNAEAFTNEIETILHEFNILETLRIMGVPHIDEILELQEMFAPDQPLAGLTQRIDTANHILHHITTEEPSGRQAIHEIYELCLWAMDAAQEKREYDEYASELDHTAQRHASTTYNQARIEDIKIGQQVDTILTKLDKEIQIKLLGVVDILYPAATGLQILHPETNTPNLEDPLVAEHITGRFAKAEKKKKAAQFSHIMRKHNKLFMQKNNLGHHDDQDRILDRLADALAWHRGHNLDPEDAYDNYISSLQKKLQAIGWNKEQCKELTKELLATEL